MTIKIHITTILISPSRGDLNPKNTGDHKKLSPSCIRKNISAVLIFFFFHPCLQIKKKETPIKKYKSVQAGPKIQLGGAKNGLLRVEYQVGIAEIVKGTLIIPTSSQPTTEIISLCKSFINLKYKTNIHLMILINTSHFETNMLIKASCIKLASDIAKIA